MLDFIFDSISSIQLNWILQYIQLVSQSSVNELLSGLLSNLKLIEFDPILNDLCQRPAMAAAQSVLNAPKVEWMTKKASHEKLLKMDGLLVKKYKKK